MSMRKDMVKRHEGLKLKPYLCPAGKLTIGFGRCLEENGISEAEADMMLENDLRRSEIEAETFHWFLDLNDARRDAIVSMLFNLGLARFLGFRKMITALERKDYDEAARQMMDSLWSQQVPKRAFELAEIMRTGHYI